MKQWPHSPKRIATGPGLYIVTASTKRREKFFHTPERLDILLNWLFTCLLEANFELQAWAVFANHYHFVGAAPAEGIDFRKTLSKVHACSAREINRLDETPGRQVWLNYRDTHLTFEKSYLARLAYVHRNPVKHGLVADSTEYQGCSAQWFQSQADRAWYETVMSFKTDEVNVEDDFWALESPTGRLNQSSAGSPLSKVGHSPYEVLAPDSSPDDVEFKYHLRSIELSRDRFGTSHARSHYD